MVRPSVDPMGDHFAMVVLELAPDGIAVTDELGRLVHANGRFEQLFGFRREQLVGHTVEMLLPERLQAVHRVHRHDYEQRPSPRPMGSGRQLWARRADGTEFPVEVALSPVTTGHGVRTIMTVREVSDRRATEDAARAEAVYADHQRIALALNDRVIQEIFSASFQLHGLLDAADGPQRAVLQAAIDELDTAIREIRSIVFHMDLSRSSDQIQAVASPRGGEAAGGQARPPRVVVEYAIDADDVVTAVDHGWTEFARANDAPELAGLAPDRTLWSYIEGDEVRDLWQLLIERVRVEQSSAHVSFRCDSPRRRRWFNMAITPRPDNAVRFRSVLVFEQPRPVVTLLQRHVERDRVAAAVLVCNWCGRGHDGAGWLDLEDLVRESGFTEETPMPSVIHGICPTCRDLMSGELLVPGSTGDVST